MKTWYKYFINPGNEKKFIPLDATFDDHKRSMEGYDSSKGYLSKEEFFENYFHRAHLRHKYYHDYLKAHLKKEDDTLSIGSGRCVNELLLMEDGFNITCSDLEQPCRRETMRLFPRLQFMNYDVTKGPASRKFDRIISLSMFYLFDNAQLSEIFKNVADSLRAEGTFILDPCGAENNLGTRLIDDFICPSEMALIKILKKIFRGEDCVVAKKHQGYRTTDAEIISIAKRAGLDLCDMEKYDYFTEFGMRSNIFGRLPKRLVGLLGRAVPYVRMFNFKKE